MDAILDFLHSLPIDLPEVLKNAEFFLRMICAALCGAIVGYERKNRLKEAGLRTHLIIALASALMMIVSKYGFFDVLDGANDIRLDPSRVASCIVTGVGFLGAGTIFVRKQVISGLTTAAGMWATAGIGMAFGSGLYFCGVAATVLVVFSQVLLHKNLKWLKMSTAEHICIIAKNSPGALEAIQELLMKKKVSAINFKAEKQEDDTIIIDAFVKLPAGFTGVEVMSILNKCEYIKSIEI